MVGAVGLAGLGLSHTMHPSADIRAREDARFSTVPRGGISPGDVRLLKEKFGPVYLWRRSPAEIARAREQDIPALWPDTSARHPLFAPHMPAYDRIRTMDGAWLAVWAVCPRPGCIVRARMGDYGGFFCPCDSAHFDLAGRFRKGPFVRNLQSAPISFSPDGEDVVLRVDSKPFAY